MVQVRLQVECLRGLVRDVPVRRPPEHIAQERRGDVAGVVVLARNPHAHRAAQALHLINGQTINDKLRGNIAEPLLVRGLANRDIIEEFYLRALTRLPEPRELAEWEPLLGRATANEEAVRDLLWTLLNSREFAFNH